MNIYLRNFHRNLVRYPVLTLLTTFLILLRNLLRLSGSEKWLVHLNKIRISLTLPDGNKIVCRIPDLIVVSDVYMIDVYGNLEPSEGSIVFDLGANIGLFSIKVATQKKTAMVIAVEPDPENFQMLLRNLELNGISTVIPLNMALAERSGKLDFFVSAANKAASSIYRHEEGMKSVEVEASTFDCLLETLNIEPLSKRMLIKMDVEGAELRILNGARGLKAAGNVKIVMETHPDLVSQERVERRLREYNFNVVPSRELPYIAAQK